MEMVMRLAAQRAVVIFSDSSCCMCHAVKTLFKELGVNAAVYEVDEEPNGKEIEKALRLLMGGRSNKAAAVPAVFIGGKFVGSLNNVMSMHMQNDLLPMLHAAGALWL